MKNAVVAAVLAVFIAAVGLSGWRAYSPAEQAVYRAIAEHVVDHKIRPKAVAVSYPSTCRQTREHMPELPDNLVAEFLKVNAAGARPLRLYAIEDTIPTISWDMNRQFFERPDLLLGRVGEEGLLALSRVAISNNGDRALLCVQSLSQQFSKGSLYYYEKDRSGWALRNIIDVWIT